MKKYSAARNVRLFLLPFVNFNRSLLSPFYSVDLVPSSGPFAISDVTDLLSLSLHFNSPNTSSPNHPVTFLEASSRRV